MILHWRIRTGSDWWFSKILRTGLDRIQFYRIRTGLGLKNFTVRSSLVCTTSSHDVRINHVTCQLIWCSSFCVERVFLLWISCIIYNTSYALPYKWFNQSGKPRFSFGYSDFLLRVDYRHHTQKQPELFCVSAGYRRCI